jgi:trigger factor
MIEDAQKRVKVSLTLEAISEAEGITATEEEINSEIEKMAVQFNMTAEQISTALGGTGALENDLRMQKTIDFLIENAKISK